MQLPEKLLQSLKDVKGFDRGAFEKVHTSGEQITSIRLNPAKASMVNGEVSINSLTHHSPLTAHDSRFTTHERVQWAANGYYLKQRPSFTFDPLFHAGCYYVQEASSMFVEQALKQTTDLTRSLKILDLSAAPGGKSTHIQSLISPGSLLVSNEVIRSRSNILKDNIIKWGCENVVVTNNDPKDFSKLEGFFDVIVIDAPCSGSGLFRKEPEAINEWSENNVALCSQRQQRILADVIPSLKKGGTLIYSTCSYSKEEDEDIVEWMVTNLKLRSQKLEAESSWNIAEIETHPGTFGYRFWPDKVKGEGFFIACFRNANEVEVEVNAKGKAQTISKKETEIIQRWVKVEGRRFVKNQNTVYEWPEMLTNEMNLILSSLRVVYSGVRVGELIRDKLIPGHALALSGIMNESITSIDLNYDQAIQYLQRKDLSLETKEKGWQLVKYMNHPLGWINVLSNRINNYYPKELRILKA